MTTSGKQKIELAKRFGLTFEGHGTWTIDWDTFVSEVDRLEGQA